MRQIPILIAEYAGGVVMGVLWGFVGVVGAFLLSAVILGPIDPPPGDDPVFGWYALPTLIGFVVGGLGAIFGPGTGVWIVGKLLSRRGSLALALCGSLLGIALGFCCTQLVSIALASYDVSRLAYDAPGVLYELPLLLSLLPLFVVPPALAVLFYHLSERRREHRTR